MKNEDCFLNYPIILILLYILVNFTTKYIKNIYRKIETVHNIYALIKYL